MATEPFGNTMRSLSLLIITLSALPHYAYSYCVYNKHSDDTSLDVRQYYDPAQYTNPFHKAIDAGGSECCPYNVYDCNPLGHGQLDPLKLWIARVSNKQEITRFSVTLPSGGYVIVDGDKVHHTVAVKNPDGTNYPTIIEYDVDFSLLNQD
ncbi:hypothetical protein BJV82DRAFT_660200 [Fennellomyces sp. T-0311]|nr:hypothetical protein BJV82DRAFT_660200 [Fennellomyces sp. T-0311]